MASKKSRQQDKREKKQESAFKIEDVGDEIIPFPSAPPQFEPVPPKKADRPPSRLTMEQMMRELHEAMEEHEFASKEELDAFIADFNQRSLQPSSKERRKRDPKHEAQDLAYKAMEADDLNTAAELAMRAVTLDRQCVDALVILACVGAESEREMVENLENAVWIGERALGDEFFEENKGHFWGLMETRPYMRARQQLAEALLEMDRIDEAIRHYEEMLQLNPGDNQGLRYPLLGLYFVADNLDGVRRLFEEFEDEGSAMFAWSLVLEQYLSGDEKGAAKALKEARKTNRHVEKYLTGKKRLPKDVPGHFGFGDENEAIICADAIGAAWKQQRQAVAWLKQMG